MKRPLSCEEIVGSIYEERENFMQLFENKEYSELRRQSGILLGYLQRSLRIALGTNQLFVIKSLPELLLSIHRLSTIKTRSGSHETSPKTICRFLSEGVWFTT